MAYRAYDDRDVPALLSVVSAGVDRLGEPSSPGRLHGREAVRACRLQQWARTRTRDAPRRFTHLNDGRPVAHVDQVVRALNGSLLSRDSLAHVESIATDLITRTDVHPEAHHLKAAGITRASSRASAPGLAGGPRRRRP